MLSLPLLSFEDEEAGRRRVEEEGGGGSRRSRREEQNHRAHCTIGIHRYIQIVNLIKVEVMKNLLPKYQLVILIKNFLGSSTAY